MSRHTCHAYKCETPCAPKMLMCARHWRMVPPFERAAIWRTYRSGQERDMNPTWEYFVAQRRAVAAVAEAEGYHDEAARLRARADERSTHTGPML